jgi:hypothetical protein
LECVPDSYFVFFDAHTPHKTGRQQESVVLSGRLAGSKEQEMSMPLDLSSLNKAVESLAYAVGEANND